MATSGTLGTLYDFVAASSNSGGAVTNRQALYIENSGGTGTIANQYGIYIDALTKGSSLNYAIYTAGTAPSVFLGGFIGSTTSDTAAAGIIGEPLEALINFTSRIGAGTTSQFKNMTSLSITAGDWDVWCTMSGSANSGTVTAYQVALSTYTGNTTSDHVFGDNTFTATNPTGVVGTADTVVTFYKRISVSTTTTYYLKGLFTYSGATPAMYGYIRARRTR